jgi:dihydropteroate synthase
MDSKDTLFCKKNTLNCRGSLLDFSDPVVMGIVNITPDSFYDGGKYTNDKALLERVSIILEEGAKIIDLGAFSTRPGYSIISVQEEIERIRPALNSIKKEFPECIVSVDTFRSEVAKFSADYGAEIINDIGGGMLDPLMFKTIADLKIPYILMHLDAELQKIHTPTSKNDSILPKVLSYFSEKINHLYSLGVMDVMIDPGFGFSKTLEQNYFLLHHLDALNIFQLPILVGASRKSMVTKVLNCKSSDSLIGTTVVNSIAVQKGASILRVHDVKETLEAIKIVKFVQNQVL